MTTASKLASGNESASALPAWKSIPGWCRRASASIAAEKSTPTTAAPRWAAAAAT